MTEINILQALKNKIILVLIKLDVGSCGQHKDVYMYDVDYSEDICDDDGDENVPNNYFKLHNTN